MNTTTTTTNTQAIRKLARIRNKATATYLERYEFPISQTATGQIEVAPSIANDPPAFERRLRDAGAILPTSDLGNFLTQVAQAPAPEELVYEAQTGWLNGFQGFVTGNGVIGTPAEKVIGASRAAPQDPSGRVERAGDWKAWRDTVGEKARLSSLFMCGISAAFAAPLLHITGSQSFTLCFFAKTRTGKSVATLMAASVLGIGKQDSLITWNTTDARLEQRIAEYNDCLFPIDDMQAMPELGKPKYLRVQQFAYRLAQGWSKARDASYTQAHGGVHERWRCICVTSNEAPIRDLAQAVKMERMLGEALRLIDTPALLDGSGHVFDRAGNKNVTEEWKLERFKEIATACASNHGHAFEKYVASLIEHGPKLKEYIEARTSFFIRHVTDEFDGALARDVAGKFALIYAGGMLARRYKLVGWDKKELLEAISKCYLNARGLLPDEGQSLRDGLAALGTKLLTLPNSSRLGKRDYDDEDGYRCPGFGPVHFIIKCDAFNAAFVTSAQKDRVLGWLMGKGHVTLATPKNGNSAEPKAQFIWPDDQRRRSYELRIPYTLLEEFDRDDDEAE